jgi:hypothetical protein
MGPIKSCMRRFLSSRPGMVVTLVVALVGTTTIGFAAATTAGVINACVNNSSGTLKIVSATDTCPTNWTALSWNQQGPEGLTGATGATGLTGLMGATGASGASGADGAAGATGATGAQGPAGPTGASGAAGPSGAQGLTGATGATGAKGEPCLSSDPACVGPKGDQGDPGTNGTTGATGAGAGLTTFDDLSGLPCSDSSGAPGRILVRFGIGPSASVTITCETGAIFTISPGFHDFGSVDIGRPTPEFVFTVTNTGLVTSNSLDVSIQQNGNAFVLGPTNTCSPGNKVVTLPVGETCRVGVILSPSFVTLERGTLVISEFGASTVTGRASLIGVTTR